MADIVSISVTASAARFASRLTQLKSYVETQGARAVEAQTRNVRQVVINTSPVDTGALKASWGPVTSRGPLAYGFGTAKDYASTLEYGGYPRVGPRTVRLGGGELGAGFVAGAGIYSQQAPLGFVRKALAAATPQFRLRLQNMLRQGWGGLGTSDVLGAREAADIFGIDLGGGTTGGFSMAPFTGGNLPATLARLRGET